MGKMHKSGGAVVIITCVFLLFSTGCLFGMRPPDTTITPSHEFNHSSAKYVTIIGEFDFYFKHDIRLIESPSDTIELKMWGDYIDPDVQFSGDEMNLTMTIIVHCAIDNDFGTPYASEYLYLPGNAHYSIRITSENGNINAGNFTGEELVLVNQRGSIRAEKGNFTRVFIENDGVILEDYTIR